MITVKWLLIYNRCLFRVLLRNIFVLVCFVFFALFLSVINQDIYPVSKYTDNFPKIPFYGGNIDRGYENAESAGGFRLLKLKKLFLLLLFFVNYFFVIFFRSEKLQIWQIAPAFACRRVDGELFSVLHFFKQEKTD